MCVLLFYISMTFAANTTVCFACHGENGISPSPLWPNLAGQKEMYLVNTLKSYRDGARNDVLMSPISKPLSDKDIEELAKYFSNLKAP